MEKVETLHIQVNKTQLRMLVADGGYDRWLLLWPGMGGTAEEFTSLLKRGPSLGVNVVSLDPPGHGLSESWTGELTDESITLIWSGVIDHFNISKVILGGHSYGAYAAFWGLERLDGQVDGLLLLDGGYLEPFPDAEFEQISEQNKAFLESRVFNSWEDFLQEERESAGSWDDDIEQMLRSTMKIQDGKIVPRIDLESANQVSALLKEFSVSKLQNVHVPALLLYATQPEEFNSKRLKGINELKGIADHLKAIPVPESGHDLFVDNPHFVGKAVRDFVLGMAEKQR